MKSSIERPIVLTGWEVKAILVGRKTQFRRPVMHTWVQGEKLKPLETTVDLRNPQPDCFPAGYCRKCGPRAYHLHLLCPFGRVGDRLWGKETFAYVSPHEDPVPYTECNIEYKADNPGARYPAGWDNVSPDCFDEFTPKWRSSIHLPQWASRVNLLITGVKVERLKDISSEDAIAEGVERNWVGPYPIPQEFEDEWLDYSEGEEGFPCLSPVASFLSLWDTQNRKVTQEANPWVWAISFEKLPSGKEVETS